MDARGIDTDPGWINRKFQAVKEEIEALRSERRAAATTIADGGSMIVRGLLQIAGSLDLTGTLLMRSEAGNDVVRMGEMPHGDIGLEFSREDGTAAFSMSKPFGPGSPQMWSLYDRDGQRVVSENDLGPGLRRPFLEHPLQPVATTTGTAVTCGPYGWERTTDSATWETLYAYDGRAQNPWIDLKFAAFCSDGTTAGEIRVLNVETGTALPGFLEPSWVGLVPAGTTSYLIVDPPNTRMVMPEVDDFGAYIRLGVQVRVTAGTGSITLAVPQSIGG